MNGTNYSTGNRRFLPGTCCETSSVQSTSGGWARVVGVHKWAGGNWLFMAEFNSAVEDGGLFEAKASNHNIIGMDGTDYCKFLLRHRLGSVH